MISERSRENWALDGGSNHSEIVKRGLWLKLIQAYLASVSFADAQVGRILKALRGRAPTAVTRLSYSGAITDTI